MAEIPDNIKTRLDIHPVKWIDQVLEMALERKPQPLPEATEVIPPLVPVVAAEAPLITKH